MGMRNRDGSIDWAEPFRWLGSGLLIIFVVLIGLAFLAYAGLGLYRTLGEFGWVSYTDCRVPEVTLELSVAQPLQVTLDVPRTAEVVGGAVEFVTVPVCIEVENSNG